MRWDIRTTTGDETCIADTYEIDPSGALMFHNSRVLVIAFGPAHWVHFAAHVEDDALNGAGEPMSHLIGVDVVDHSLWLECSCGWRESLTGGRTDDVDDVAAVHRLAYEHRSKVSDQ